MTNSTFKLASTLLFWGLVLLVSYMMHFFLPQKAILTISGENIKRVESKAKPDDIFYIYTKQGDAVYVFKNMDTLWGFPPYLKFNAAEMQAQAQSLVGREVLVTYYGWRNKIFGMFPNVLKLTPYEEGMSTTAWARGVIYTLWILLVLMLFPRFYSLMERQQR